MHTLGLMSGTSVDSVDAVIARLDEDPLTDRPFELIITHSHPIPPALRAEIQALMHGTDNELERLAALDVQLGELFAEAALAVLKKSALTAADIATIGSHGQTLRHRPRATPPFTVQAGSPSIIAERTGITVVADFRPRDIAAGGEGAPLVPAFHRGLFASPDRHRAIVNIGGIANVTLLPAGRSDAASGFDTGPGNTLLDNWHQQHRGTPCDTNGDWATSGKIDDELLKRLLADPYFAAPPPKSTGREHFHLAWLESRLAGLGPLAPADVQATLSELTARSIADAIFGSLPAIDEVYVCGGGAHNRDLMARLARALRGKPLHSTGELGLDPDWVEAAAFAWLAWQTLHGRPGNLPAVTGARRPVILGGIYPA